MRRASDLTHHDGMTTLRRAPLLATTLAAMLWSAACAAPISGTAEVGGTAPAATTSSSADAQSTTANTASSTETPSPTSEPTDPPEEPTTTSPTDPIPPVPYDPEPPALTGTLHDQSTWPDSEYGISFTIGEDIYCAMSGPDSDGGWLRCDIYRAHFGSPPRAVTCDGAWGFIFISYPDYTGLGCAGDATMPGPRLATGDGITNGEVTCIAGEDSAYCSRPETGGSFHLTPSWARTVDGDTVETLTTPRQCPTAAELTARLVGGATADGVEIADFEPILDVVCVDAWAWIGGKAHDPDGSEWLARFVFAYLDDDWQPFDQAEACEVFGGLPDDVWLVACDPY